MLPSVDVGAFHCGLWMFMVVYGCCLFPFGVMIPNRASYIFIDCYTCFSPRTWVKVRPKMIQTDPKCDLLTFTNNGPKSMVSRLLTNWLRPNFLPIPAAQYCPSRQGCPGGANDWNSQELRWRRTLQYCGQGHRVMLKGDVTRKGPGKATSLPVRTT